MKKSKIQFAHFPVKRIPEHWYYINYTEEGDLEFEYTIERLPKHRGWVLIDHYQGEVVWTGPSLRICKHIVRVLVTTPSKIWSDTAMIYIRNTHHDIDYILRNLNNKKK